MNNLVAYAVQALRGFRDTEGAAGPDPGGDISRKGIVAGWNDTQYILYNGNLHSLPNDGTLEKLAMEPDVDDLIHKRVTRMVFEGGHIYCAYCEFSSVNLGTVFLTGQAAIVEGKMPCTYQWSDGVGLAIPYTNRRTGAGVIAQHEPCIVYDSMILALGDLGFFEGRKIEGTFTFPTLDEIRHDPAIEAKYRIASNPLKSVSAKIVSLANTLCDF